ncbi:hypothetical protein ABGT15_06225 [Flavobacterium enshiense]|uniref:hypothetical protein n=1 Tax=Flavobacterium enshiense TaxID=1341165 RepID=UPI00345DABF9
MKHIFTLICLLFIATAFSQQIRMEKGKFYVKGDQISSRETKQMLTTNPEALKLFKKGKNKESLGGFLIGFGGAMIVGDVVVGLVSDANYPSAMSYIGAASVLTSIPVMSGKNKKMKQGIDLYNKGVENTLGYHDKPTVDLNIIANGNGYGIQIAF